MGLHISSFDGYQFGSFDETDKQQSDKYTTKSIPRWYGRILERSNERTEFTIWRDVQFDTLRNAIAQRLNSVITQTEFEKRPATLSETEYRAMLRASERADTINNIQGVDSVSIAGNLQAVSTINELSLITMIDKYAYRAPAELKLQAAIEYAVWIIRQPMGSNKSNGLIRSGAATFLDGYRYRGI